MTYDSYDSSVHDRLLRNRVLFVDREVDDDLANRITAQLLLLAGEDPADITMYINTPGGAIDAGMAVIDTMRYVSCDVSTFAIGLAAGMGQCLLTAGTKGKRYAVPHARILLLAPTLQKARHYGALERTRQRMAELLAADTGQTADRIRADWGPDSWFTAEQAAAYGLIDHVAALPE